MGSFSVTDTLQSVTVSIVSHGQGKLVSALLEDLAKCSSVYKVLLTQNIPEDEITCPESLRPQVHLIRNEQPRGFSANHNHAFQQCTTPLFAVLNPDLRLEQDPFPPLNNALSKNNAGVIAPRVCNPEGGIEDSARRFPTLPGLFAKFLGLNNGCIILEGQTPQSVDWTAGMFLLFKTEVFRDIGGFDDGYFLYYEDVDICVRLWNAGSAVVLHPGISVIHAAQRASRRRLSYMAWHLSSMLRYFCKHAWRLPRK